MKHSKTMPKGEARPLGMKAKRRTKRAQKPIDTAPSSIVESLQIEALPPVDQSVMTEQEPEKRMTLILRSLSKNGKNAMYTGAAAVLRLPLAAFPDRQAPTALTSLDQLAAKVERVPRVKLTKEERAALPKPTEAEKVARMEIALAKRKAKLEAAAFAASPSL